MTESQANKLQALAWASPAKQSDSRLGENLAKWKLLFSPSVFGSMDVKAMTIFVQRVIQLKVGCMLEMAQLPGVPAPSSLCWEDLHHRIGRQMAKSF